MLQSINDRAKGILGWIIIAFISIPFALWGIQEYLGDAPDRFAAKVNDSEISVRAYEEALIRHKQRLESMFGGNLPNDPVFEKRIKDQVVDQLVARTLLEQRTFGAGFRVSDTHLSNKIQSMEPFLQDGKFIPATYQAILQSQGMSPAQFEVMLRRDLIVGQLQDGVTQSSFAGAKEAQIVKRIQDQTRDISFIEFKQDGYASEVSLSDEEVQQYYEQHKSNYMHPEKVSISYVELKADDISVDVPVDEEALRRQYDEYVASLIEKEERKARHILVQFDENADEATKAEKKTKIEGVLRNLRSGASFDELAKTESDDPGSAAQGGDLGWVTKGMMVPAFEDALFKLKKGQLSEVVQSSFGYHIVKLDDIKGAQPESFESRQKELVKELKQNEIDNAFYERSELIATIAYENDQVLEPVAEALGVKIKKSELFTRVNGKDIANNQAVRDAAFSSAVLKENRNSDVIEVGKNHIVVLRINEHVATKPKTFDEVKNIVESSLKVEKVGSKVSADAEKAMVELKAGKALLEVANTKYGTLNKLGNIKRDYTGVNASIVSEAFRMNKPGADKPEYKTVQLNDGIAVVILNSVTEKAEQPKMEDLQLIARQIEAGLSNQEMSAVLDFIESQSEIIKTKDL